MSEDKNKKKEPARALPVTPEATNPELFEWMDHLWDHEHPTKIHVVELHRREGLWVRGDVHDHQNFDSTGDPPKKETILALSNRLVAAAQRDCDMRRRPQSYRVEAYNLAKGADMYSGFPLPLEPKNLYLRSNNAQPTPINGFDDSEDGTDPYGSDKLLRRTNALFKEAETNREMFLAAMGHIIKILSEANLDYREENEKLRGRLHTLFDDLEKTKSAEEDRKLARDRQTFWLGQMRDGAHLVKGLLPPIVNKMVGQKLVPDESSPVMLVLRGFLQSCTDEQIEAAFGKWDKESQSETPLIPGFFTIRQTYILNGLADGKIAPNYLDNLIDGDDRITPEQMAEAQRVFSNNQLLPIQNLIMTRLKERMTTKSESRSQP